MSADTLAAAREYHCRGFRVVPVPTGQKGPRILRWQDLDLKPEELPKHFSAASNVGVILGPPPSELVDIDLDCTEASPAAAAY